MTSNNPGECILDTLKPADVVVLIISYLFQFSHLLLLTVYDDDDDNELVEMPIISAIMSFTKA